MGRRLTAQLEIQLRDQITMLAVMIMPPACTGRMALFIRLSTFLLCQIQCQKSRDLAFTVRTFISWDISVLVLDRRPVTGKMVSWFFLRVWPQVHRRSPYRLMEM